MDAPEHSVSAADWIRQQVAHEYEVYPKRDVVLVRGEGTRVWDADGKEYLDCAAGHGVASLGHCHEAVVRAVESQVRRLITCPGTYYNDQKAQLLQRLAAIAPSGLDRAFLCNSGTEAIEGAVKFARFATGRTDFICFNRSYHGRSCGALSATFRPEYRKPFEPLVPGFSFVAFNKLEQVASAVTDQTAGVLLEVIQGEGGIHVAQLDFLDGLRQLCDERGLLLIVDEIQSGFGRSGRMFACEHFDLVPDMLCVAKAMAGGLPMGAILCRRDLEAPLGRHGSTFGGNPLCCAAAVSVIDTLRAGRLIEDVEEKGNRLVRRLKDAALPIVREIRGMGLMIGIDCRVRVKAAVLALLERGIITLPTGPTVLRLLPPLTISDDEIDAVANALVSVLGETSAAPK